MRTMLPVLVAGLALFQAAPPTLAQAAPYCAAGQTPHFQFGFQSLAALLGPTMGQPTECEHANASNGDTLQHTMVGLAFYRASTNTPTFTDGYNHWALTTGGPVRWTGDSIDPPPETLAAHAADVAFLNTMVPTTRLRPTCCSPPARPSGSSF